MNASRIGVCGWSIDRNDPVRSIEIAATQLDLRVIQLGLFGGEVVRGFDVARVGAVIEEHHVDVVGCFVAFDGEAYDSIAQIAQTGGLLPDATYEQRQKLLAQAADVTAAVGGKSLAIHVGTIPGDIESDEFAKLAERAGIIADFAATHGLRLLLETGRESAEVLVHFMAKIDRDNVGVNYDPGNFVLYGTDDPVKAVSKLKGLIDVVHLKDAVCSAEPGVEWGSRAALGNGDAQIARVLSKLRIGGFDGPLLIEGDSRAESLAPIVDAAAYVRSMIV